MAPRTLHAVVDFTFSQWNTRETEEAGRISNDSSDKS
jgi:hypothetical protein